MSLKGGSLLISKKSWHKDRSFLSNLLVQPWTVPQYSVGTVDIGNFAIPLPRVWLVILFFLLIKKKSIQKKVGNSAIGQFCIKWKNKIDSYEKKQNNFQARNDLKKNLKRGLVAFAAIEFYKLYADYKNIAVTPSVFPQQSWWDDIMLTHAKGGTSEASRQRWSHLIPYIVAFCFALSLPIFGTQKLKEHLAFIRSRFPFCKVFASKIQSKLETDPILNNISAADVSTQKLFVSEAGAAVKDDILLKKSTGTQKRPTKPHKKKRSGKHTGKH